ncbi:MAG: RNA polymerase subunit sigma [Candidatus Marinimicrobia bacterium CG08_land_8_20_14_0_20_45_22]|nr:MAG: RNA polymerase subunit sigma [Candidatus Marinimicrobia bacterium CG08_land_8_20_14_0_20_45_22]
MPSPTPNSALIQAVKLIRNSTHTTAFTGAGVSVESGIPPFRGENGLWAKIDPVFLDIQHFYKFPDKSWQQIKAIFYDTFGKAKPNYAHYALADLEKRGLLNVVITQNIDNLHQQAGSTNVIEFHGTAQKLVCTNCGRRFESSEKLLSVLPPRCEECRGLLKPDFVFFGEPIPETANRRSIHETEVADVFILIGTTGKIQPASMMPIYAKNNGAKIIEINIGISEYTNSITDVFLNGKATEEMNRLMNILN